MRHRCSATDIAHLLDYLSHDKRQGPHLAREIREGGVTVLHCEIKRSLELGAVKQWWRTAPGEPPKGAAATPHLIVQNSVEGLRAWNTDEGRDHVWRIRQRMDDLTKPDVEIPPLVIGWERGEWVLKDGNYTAAALYHNWVAHPPAPIRVYTLHPLSWSPSMSSGRFADVRV